MSEREVRVSPHAFAKFQEEYQRALSQGYSPDIATRRCVLFLGSPIQGWDIGAYKIVVDWSLKP